MNNVFKGILSFKCSPLEFCEASSIHTSSMAVFSLRSFLGSVVGVAGERELTPIWPSKWKPCEQDRHALPMPSANVESIKHTNKHTPIKASNC